MINPLKIAKIKITDKSNEIRHKISDFLALNKSDKAKIIKNFILDKAMFIIIISAIIAIAIMRPRFLSAASIINIISLTAAKLPIALGIGGAIVLSGTDISAGRAVGLTATVTASLLQSTGYAAKIFPNLPTLPIPVVIPIVLAVGALIGLLNGFFVAKFKLHPFIVTLSTQLIIFGAILLFLQIGDNGGQTLSGLSPTYTSFISGPLFSVGGIPVPRYVLYSAIITLIMWVVWNKTVFGKNIFAVG